MTNEIEIKKRLEEYHFNSYKNLVLTLVTLNSAGIAAAIAFMHIIMDRKCNPKVADTLCTNLDNAVNMFTIGLLLILTEIYIEYISYFLHYKCINNHFCHNDKLCYKDLFEWVQILLLVLSGIFLIIGGFYFINVK